MAIEFLNLKPFILLLFNTGQISAFLETAGPGRGQTRVASTGQSHLEYKIINFNCQYYFDFQY